MRTGVAIVALHYAASIAHGLVHQGPPVPLTTAQTGFVVVVVGLAPLGSLFLFYGDRSTLAWGSLAVVLGASFAFGVVFHFLVESPDLVANVTGAWHGPFAVTAIAIAIVDGAGGAYSLWRAWDGRRRAGGPDGVGR